MAAEGSWSGGAIAVMAVLPDDRIGTAIIKRDGTVQRVLAGVAQPLVEPLEEHRQRTSVPLLESVGVARKLVK